MRAPRFLHLPSLAFRPVRAFLFLGRVFVIADDQFARTVAKLVTFAIGHLHHLCRDVFGHIARPAFDRVERNHAHDVRVLAGEDVFDQGPVIGADFVSLPA